MQGSTGRSATWGPSEKGWQKVCLALVGFVNPFVAAFWARLTSLPFRLTPQDPSCLFVVRSTPPPSYRPFGLKLEPGSSKGGQL